MTGGIFRMPGIEMAMLDEFLDDGGGHYTHNKKDGCWAEILYISFNFMAKVRACSGGWVLDEPSFC
jgi:hypothetical protein